MKIAVNTRLLLKNRLEGMGWFTYETLKRMTADHPEHHFIFIFDRSYDSSFIFSDHVTPVVIGPPARHPFLFYLWFEFQVPRILRNYRADLFLSPDGYLSLRTTIPQLAVIHDISFMHRPQDIPWLKRVYYQWFFPKFAWKARRIATVSNYSRQDIARTFQIDPGKIDVVYDGVNEGFGPMSDARQQPVRNSYTGGDPYFLFVGALHPRKNIEGLLRAYDTFSQHSGKRVKLLIVGAGMHKTGDIFNVYNRMEFKDDVAFTGRVTNQELFRIYGAATALVYVPFFEGFGIPILEAMCSGVPVICSNTTSMPEVGGDAVCYVDPGNTQQIADAMNRMVTEPGYREQLIQKGFQQKEMFSWDQTAKLLWASIEEMVRSTPV